MKKILFSLLILSLCTSSLFAGEEDKDTIVVSPKVKINVSAAIKNQHYWRGYAVATSPLMTSMVSVITKSGFEIGTWNGFGLDGGFKDVDTYISYSKGGFSIALWDVYNFSDYDISSASFPYGNFGNSNYFNYSGKGRHFIDASIGYAVPRTKLSLFLATIVAGRDINKNGDSAYSTYFKTSYGLTAGDVSITPYTSVGFALNSIEGENFWKWTKDAGKNTSNFNFSEVGINFSKPIKISEKVSIGASAGFVVSPVNKTASGLFGITLF
ncbi:MAG TPA: hypothetical protein VGB63_13450 [Pedobacter sp.]|jgi:hypothetical protein